MAVEDYDVNAVNERIKKYCETKVNTVASTKPAPEAPVSLPENLRPTFVLKWGASDKDQIETTDTETLCIVAANEHTDVSFRDLTVVNIVMSLGGNVPDKKFLNLTPEGMISFGDLMPGQSVAREVRLKTYYADPGDYELKIYHRATIDLPLNMPEAFPLTLILDDPF